MNSTSIYRLYPKGYEKGNLKITDDEARDRGMPSAAELVGCVGEVYTEEAAKEAREQGFIVKEEKMDTDDTDWYKDHCCGCDAALASENPGGGIADDTLNPLSHACPDCGAAPGEPCEDPGVPGEAKPGYHVSRLERADP